MAGRGVSRVVDTGCTFVRFRRLTLFSGEVISDLRFRFGGTLASSVSMSPDAPEPPALPPVSSEPLASPPVSLAVSSPSLPA